MKVDSDQVFRASPDLPEIHLLSRSTWGEEDQVLVNPSSRLLSENIFFADAAKQTRLFLLIFYSLISLSRCFFNHFSTQTHPSIVVTYLDNNRHSFLLPLRKAIVPVLYKDTIFLKKRVGLNGSKLEDHHGFWTCFLSSSTMIAVKLFVCFMPNS